MEHDPRAWLWDVRQAADRIAQFVEHRSLAEYLADTMLRSAVERQFEIIGEGPQSSVQERPGYRGAHSGPSARGRYAQCLDPCIPGDRPPLRAQVVVLLAELGETP